MVLTQRLDLRQTQALVMTPQLQQAIKLLQLSNVELTAFVETELEQNPLLERDEGGAEALPEGAAGPELAGPAEAAPAPAAAEPAPLEGSERSLWEDGGDEASAEAAGEEGVSAGPDSDGWTTRSGRGEGGGEALPGLDQLPGRAETLRDHLLSQLNVDIDDPRDRMIGIHLIDLLDEAGYLTSDLAPVAAQLGCAPARVEAVLVRLQRFDPAGVFARSLAECLALQLKERDRLDPAMQALLDHLPLLASRNAAALMRLCGVDGEDLAQMVSEIKSLDPKPGLAFDGVLAQPVTPDIIMRAQPGGGWLVELNSDTLPRVLVNTRYYLEVNRGTRDKAEKDYLAERYQSANWLVKSLHQRATTILKVASEIVRQQDAFFRQGVQHLRPLVLRDIAAAIGMHESTVSRVTTNKYMVTPRGIYELKYFFTSSIAAARGGDAHSAEAVRFRIKHLIEGETGDEVLSDDRIVEILLKDGVDIARRTVAKYREAMRIPSSIQRRREKAMLI